MEGFSRSGIGIFFLATLFFYAGCRNAARQITILDRQPASQLVEAQLKLSVPTDTMHVLFSGLRQKDAVSKYYQTYGSDPAWIERGHYSSHADSLVNVVRHAACYGLESAVYHLSEIENLMRSSRPVTSVRCELLLTDAFLSMAGDLKFGVFHSAPKRNEDTLRIKLLNRVWSYGAVKKQLEAQEPALDGYKSLKEGLRLVLDSARRYPVDSVLFNAKVRLISINLERWRREAIAYGDRYIFVNIPSFTLGVIENGCVVLSSSVIVGTPDMETPVLSSTVECFSIYPYWHVPRKISVEEYLPVLKKDTAFLRRNNFDVLDRKGNVLNADSVPWNNFTEKYFPVVLRQRHGADNSLGVIKFIFDNPYAVYLHDTNAKRLFKQASRALSHGCIRMERAVDLAHYLVTGAVEIESKTVTKYLKQKQQHWIALKRPIPIYTRYYTCEFKNGVVHFYRDIYGKDRQLYKLLYKESADW